MRPPNWDPPVETSAAEDEILKRVKRAKLFVFLRRHRHQIFTPEFQVELAGIYKDSPKGFPPVEPALLALALILQAYTGVSGAGSWRWIVWTPKSLPSARGHLSTSACG
jgi:hypothetical protein